MPAAPFQPTWTNPTVSDPRCNGPLPWAKSPGVVRKITGWFSFRCSRCETRTGGDTVANKRYPSAQQDKKTKPGSMKSRDDFETRQIQTWSRTRALPSMGKMTCKNKWTESSRPKSQKSSDLLNKTNCFEWFWSREYCFFLPFAQFPVCQEPLLQLGCLLFWIYITLR